MPPRRLPWSGGGGLRATHSLKYQPPSVFLSSELSCTAARPVLARGLALVSRAAGPGQAISHRRITLQEVSLLVAELPPDPVGVDRQVLQFAGVARTPDVLQDHPAGTDLSGIAGQEGKEVEFPGREVDRPAAVDGFAVDQIQVQGADAQLCRAFLPAAGSVMP